MADREYRTELQDLAQALADQARTLQSFGLRHVSSRREPATGQRDDAVAPALEPAAPAGRAQAHMFAGPSPAAAPPPETGPAGRTPPPSAEQAVELLEGLERSMSGCDLCPLARNRKTIVFGEGDPRARLMLVGEGPGGEEDRSGRPFVGPAGQLLERILAAMGLAREQVYICNVVKCRPPRNRTPEEREMRTCGQFLNRQLEIIRPEHILCLGATAARYLLNTDRPMNRLRGQFFDHPTGARVMPTYHPAYLLRNESAKRPVWEDVQKVMAELNRPKGA